MATHPLAFSIEEMGTRVEMYTSPEWLRKAADALERTGQFEDDAYDVMIAEPLTFGLRPPAEKD